MKRFKKINLNPVMTFLILILFTLILSGFLNLIGFEATYNKINIETGEYTVVSESVESLFNLSGIKYIFSSTVSNFTAFTPLSMLIIVLIGIGIMEKSGFCMRRFCPSTQRSFDMDIIHCSSVDQLGLGYTIPFATMQKPFMCTCCCICRPEIEVRLNSTSQSIGKVKYICTMCDPTFEVYSMTGGLKYIVTADCCQCALRCPGFISKTSRGTFEILDASNNQRVGQITKEPSASVSEMITDADTYVVNFPPTADANDKLLLIGLTMLLDYQYFETDADTEKKGEERSRRSGGVKVKTGGKRRRK